MALDTGNYISDLSRLNPTATDPVSEGDDVLRFIKKILQKTFPMGTDSTANTGVGPDQAVQVIIAKSSAPTIGGSAAESMGLVWLDTSNDLVKMRNQANDAWITLPFDPETNQKIISLAGTVDGTVIGGTTSAAITGTTIVADTKHMSIHRLQRKTLTLLLTAELSTLIWIQRHLLLLVALVLTLQRPARRLLSTLQMEE